ncbi:MAG: NtrC family Transcriptional regulator, ATPase domain [Firmicutes bacterium]|nr:NtrC family Transcriptional regulator, ATPase domain [Bacillota bacterium]
MRKEKVLETLREMCRELTLEDIKNGIDGFDAASIGKNAGFNRNNTSKELNALNAEKKVIKIRGRPVYFLDRETVEKVLNRQLKDELLEADSTNALIECNSNMEPIGPRYNNVFEKLIGSEGSLKVVIDQAKAAILYPPRGLPTLLIGDTGVGKTTFAEMMLQYAIECGRLPQNAPFTIFNCSEYADNPQLLLSQMFGYIKGAFTGAEKDKPGLVEKTDGGILLLDEIHRLSPEGQEMLFLFLDKGLYRRLGETEAVRKANMLIVGATTEDINSSLLRTFLRRIPMVIKLPSLAERPFSERYRLVKQFFKDEFKRVQVPIKVYKDVIKALLLYECTGNIGQLKGDIQLICARAFLEYKSYGRDFLEVDTHLLPGHVHNGLLNSKTNREEIINLLQLDSSKYQIFSQHCHDDFSFTDNYSVSDELYKEIGAKWNLYMEKGYPHKQVKEIINSQIEEYFTRLLKRCNTRIKDNSTEFYKLVSPRVMKAVEIALDLAKQKLGKEFSDKVKFGLAMHVSTLLERLREGKVSYNSQINKIAIDYPKEFNTAKLIRRILEEELEISIPKEEICFITMFLYAADTNGQNRSNSIGVIVLAHGKSTASSMVDVANDLLGTEHARAIDMPLDKSVEDVLSETVEMAKEIDRG